MIFELRDQPGSDVVFKEFFSKFGLEDFWTFLRTTIIGNNTNFLLTILGLFFLYLISYKYDSVIMQVLSGISFVSLIIFKIVL